MAKSARAVLLVTLTTLLVGCDHATKLMAERALEGAPPLKVVPGLVDLHYAPNYDIAFSLLRGIDVDKRWPLVAFSSLAVLALSAWAWRYRRHASRIEVIGASAIIAGALGNVIDRVLRGYVVDFVRLPHWPTFNLADVFIVLGVAALFVGRSRRDPSGGPSKLA